jgi:hypothetical protein
MMGGAKTFPSRAQLSRQNYVTFPLKLSRHGGGGGVVDGDDARCMVHVHAWCNAVRY